MFCFMLTAVVCQFFLLLFLALRGHKFWKQVSYFVLNETFLMASETAAAFSISLLDSIL
jgi:hypothetical protein